MDERKRSQLNEIEKELKELYNRLVDLTESGTNRRRTEQEELLGDALDSLGEAIGCVEEALEEE